MLNDFLFLLKQYIYSKLTESERAKLKTDLEKEYEELKNKLIKEYKKC